MSISQYTLMNKNTELAVVLLSSSGYISDVLSVINPEAFPWAFILTRRRSLLSV